MAKRYQQPQGVKDDGCANRTVHVELAEVANGRDATLIEPEYVLLQPNANVFENLVHDAIGEIGMIALQIADQGRE